MTVLKAGFLGSGRFGSGVIVARLGDGSWSAPSAIGTVGGGFGGQIGFELTDFVFILNDYMSVKTFSQAGTLTLGGNVSIAAGPVGRNAEAAGGASLKGVGGVFAYSKTKGLFAGVSLEGGGIVERRDENEKLYGQRLKASQILQGSVPAPPAADSLMGVLHSRVFSSYANGGGMGDNMYNDIPIYDESHEDVVWQGRRGNAYGEGVPTNRTGRTESFGQNEYEYRDAPGPRRANTWQDDVYDRGFQSPGGLSRSSTARANPTETFDSLDRRSRAPSSPGANDYVYSDRPKPSRPTAPKPVFSPQKTGVVGPNQARAKFTFDAEADGDLGFKKGEIITILKRTENETDWWTGRIGTRTGIFPRYVEYVTGLHFRAQPKLTRPPFSNYVEAG